MNEWPECTVPNCTRPCKKNPRGNPRPYCSAHQKRLELHGDVRADVPIREGLPPHITECQVPGCERRREAGTRWCSAHLQRWTKYHEFFEDVPVGAMSAAIALPEVRRRLQENAQ